MFGKFRPIYMRLCLVCKYELPGINILKKIWQKKKKKWSESAVRAQPGHEVGNKTVPYLHI
jgi:hypothetical protein